MNTKVVFRYVAWELRRNLRMLDSMFFIVVLPIALYLMFGATSNLSEMSMGRGNPVAFVMINMAIYGAVTATTSTAGAAAVERSSGWGRQLNLTALSDTGYIVGKVITATVISLVPVIGVFAVGAVTGADIDQWWVWPATAVLVVLTAAPFALYGLAAALLLRSEAAVSGASGLLVVLAFFGNLFAPLDELMLTISKFTPLYGSATISRWPMTEGKIFSPSAQALQDTELWVGVVNLIVWTIIFAAVCLVASRRSTHR
ncbi:ABC transporter permease [Corynebacterium sp. TAE3-ERU12]|uniref:ABC transporter permease n=1 Tax=Corynebacterium sp. TAE3-ERU12 TaxID=2849491 RepID=UPI001C437F75|nr:ABC transporter permease [Corynebacterium sp. TAE3-ERU12]MBV7295555.1 ABC transporter permease [Corynebacterium sp. TAE3-ERU12]